MAFDSDEDFWPGGAMSSSDIETAFRDNPRAPRKPPPEHPVEPPTVAQERRKPTPPVPKAPQPYAKEIDDIADWFIQKRTTDEDSLG